MRVVRIKKCMLLLHLGQFEDEIPSRKAERR